MKKSIVFMLAVLTGVLLFSDTVEHYQEIEFPELEFNGEYLQIEYENCIKYGEEGAPLIPWHGIDLLLPPNQEVTSVNIIDKEYYPVEETGVIEPAARPFPISKPAPSDYQAIPDPSIYERDAIYPVNILSEAYTGYLSGHGIASLQFCPVEYNPVTRTIRFIKSVTISMETETSSRAAEVEAKLRGTDEVHNRIERIVDNPSAISQYSYTRDDRLIDYDLLLITNSELEPFFQDYVEYKRSTGYSTAVELVEDIYVTYTGIDEASQVRNCIISYYENYGIDYVIMGGDAGNSNEEAIVPHRGFAVDDEPSLPSDMYFSNLDGTWNNDGDGYWGEQNEIDPYSEVLIGRICVDSAAEVTNAVNKHILYQNDPVIEDIERVVMVGEELNDNPQTNGGDYKDQIANGGSYDGYYTEGVSNNFNINYFYERDMNWNKYDLFDEFSDTGINLLNHLGHSSPTYNMKMENSDLTNNNFTNNGITRGFAIGYSQGCYNGSFDNWHYNGYYTQDCFAEKISVGISGGEVACIANSRYGWYMPGGTNSSSQYYDRMFFHGIFGEGLSKVGEVNQYSHEEDVSMMQNNSNMRWVCYQTNLFGDPTLDIWTEEPTDISMNYPATLPIGISEVQIISDTPNTRIGLVQDGELIGRALTDENGVTNLETFEPIDSPGLISVSAIAHNKNRFLGNIVIVTDQPYVVMEAIEIEDVEGNNNGELDYGETANLGISLNNVGNEPALGVTATIITLNQHLTIIDNTLYCGDIAGDTTIDFEGAFTVEIADDVEDQHEAVIILEITDSEGTVWGNNFTLTMNAPNITFGYAEIDDSTGNNDGVIDAGETILMSIPTMNAGHAITEEIISVLLNFDQWVNIETVSTILDPLEAGEMAEAEFSISISPDTPEGTELIFNYNASAGNYASSIDYNFRVGLVLEDFENGNFDTYPWVFAGTEWQIDDLAYNGNYSARSGTIGNNSTTSLMIETWINSAGEISFYKKVSCEVDPDNHNFDWLGFYIDGQQIERWDGEDPWSQESYYVTEGLHTFEWRYRKDQAVSSGSDAGWVDYIVFPPMGLPPAPEMVADISEIELELMPDSETSQEIVLENLGVGDLNYSVQVEDTTGDGRDLSGSELSCMTDSYTPGETSGWVFNLSNESGDGESITDLYLDFPEGVTVNISTGFYGGTNALMPDGTTGNGVEVHWYHDEGLLAGESATAGVNVTVDMEYEGEVILGYVLMGSDGNEVSGNIYLYSLGIGWCNLSHNTGTIGTFDTDELTVYFSSMGLNAGIYTANILISDERAILTIPVTMTVLNTPVIDEELPEATKLVGVYPNPFNPDTNIEFILSKNSNIILDIYNIRGQMVTRLVKGEYKAGEHVVHWDGKDNRGRFASSGIYLCRFSAISNRGGRPDGNSGEPTDYTTVTKIALMK